MASEWPPAPPEGYRKHDPEYEQSWFVTAILFCWLIGVFVGVLTFVSAVHGPDTVVRIVRVILQPDTASEWASYIGWVVGTFAVLLVGHEVLHAFAGRWFGLRTAFQFEYHHPLSWSPEIVTYGGFQSRSQLLAIALAPLIILTPVSIVALVWSQHLWIIASAAVLALGNSAGAVGDLASVWTFWDLPDGELIYHDSEGRRQYYTPMNEEK
ncbi:DUF3267 domain-containing protein (plasmid) [Halococcus dombrowskii]|uniref:DUF3267 domain-containing protein n=1 Tax=Halococcus dombrowskii TaxID=179637 RepID=A0AAX3ASU5_HALDO|nr:DUF3267 domain-containing protein [Halococcus dombrowskii]UOO97204.1 DUF3267 domain-containing protein [Halococcus dombrowskii]